MLVGCAVKKRDRSGWMRMAGGCALAGLLSCGLCGVQMMSEGPRPDGSIGWSQSQGLLIQKLELTSLVLWIAAAYYAFRAYRS